MRSFHMDYLYMSCNELLARKLLFTVITDTLRVGATSQPNPDVFILIFDGNSDFILGFMGIQASFVQVTASFYVIVVAFQVPEEFIAARTRFWGVNCEMSVVRMLTLETSSAFATSTGPRRMGLGEVEFILRNIMEHGWTLLAIIRNYHMYINVMCKQLFSCHDPGTNVASPLVVRRLLQMLVQKLGIQEPLATTRTLAF